MRGLRQSRWWLFLRSLTAGWRTRKKTYIGEIRNDKLNPLLFCTPDVFLGNHSENNGIFVRAVFSSLPFSRLLLSPFRLMDHQAELIAKPDPTYNRQLEEEGEEPIYILTDSHHGQPYFGMEFSSSSLSRSIHSGHFHLSVWYGKGGNLTFLKLCLFLCSCIREASACLHFFSSSFAGTVSCRCGKRNGKKREMLTGAQWLVWKKVLVRLRGWTAFHLMCVPSEPEDIFVS